MGECYVYFSTALLDKQTILFVAFHYLLEIRQEQISPLGWFTTQTKSNFVKAITALITIILSWVFSKLEYLNK